MVQASFLDSVLNPVFSPMLKLGVFWAIFIISLLLTFVTTIIYKFVTNQKLLKSLRDDLKKLQTDMKGVKDKPTKVMALQKELMSKNMEYMRHSMWSTLFTILPVLIIFGWLNTNVAFESIHAGDSFNVTLSMTGGFSKPPKVEVPTGIELTKGYPKGLKDLVQYNFVGAEGKYEAPPISFKYPMDSCPANGTCDAHENCDVPVIITSKNGAQYSNPLILCKTPHMQSALISNKPMRPIGDISLFGWHPGWFGTYIILSMVFSIVLRKLLKVY